MINDHPINRPEYMKMRFLVCLIFLIPSLKASAQSGSPVLESGLLLNFNYGFQLPGADLADRFGQNNIAGLGIYYLTKKSNWIFGIDGGFIFGADVKEDPLAVLRTEEGFIYGNNKSPANIQLRQRGLLLIGSVGKIIPLVSDNPRSGLKIAIGAGLLQHKIRIQEDPVSFVPQVSGAYKKGYDHLSNGLAFYQFIGYQHLGKLKRLNFSIGIEVIEAVTQNRRTLNFDTFAADNENRSELLFGIRAGFIIPLYFGKGEGIWY